MDEFARFALGQPLGLALLLVFVWLLLSDKVVTGSRLTKTETALQKSEEARVKLAESVDKANAGMQRLLTALGVDGGA